MPIEFRCPNCDKKLKTGDDKAGKTAKCPQCATEITVPGASVTGEEDDFGGFPSFDDFGASPTAQPPRQAATASGPVACPMCGAENDASATACYACGEDLMSAGAGQSGSRGVAPFDVGDQLSKGFEIFKEEMGNCILATLIYLLVPGAINFVLNIVITAAAVAIAGGDPLTQNVIQQSIQIPAFFIQVFFDAGYTLFLLNLIRRRPASVGDVFSGGPYFLSLALNRFILMLATMGPFIPAAIPLGMMAAVNPQDPTGYVIATIVLGLIGAIVSIVITVMVWPYCWVVVDRNPGGLSPMKASVHLTSGHRMEIVLMGVLFWLLWFAGFLACCVGLLFTVPIATLMTGIGYDRLIRAKGLGV